MYTFLLIVNDVNTIRESLYKIVQRTYIVKYESSGLSKMIVARWVCTIMISLEIIYFLIYFGFHLNGIYLNLEQ